MAFASAIFFCRLGGGFGGGLLDLKETMGQNQALGLVSTVLWQGISEPSYLTESP